MPTTTFAIDNNELFRIESELELERQRREYDDLTAKYDLLEEDYLSIKGKLVAEKENIQRWEHFRLQSSWMQLEF